MDGKDDCTHELLVIAVSPGCCTPVFAFTPESVSTAVTGITGIGLIF
jgi:hypothetical protein